MLQIVLIRPGATDYDQQGRIQGNLNIPLCQQGAQEVATLVEQLRGRPLTALYSASCQAARETGQALASALHVRLKVLDHFPNLDHGLWQGMLIEEVRHKHPKVYRQWQDQPHTVCPPEGETVADVESRIQAALKKLFKKHRDGAVGLIAPEPLASLICVALDRREIGDLWRAGQAHGRFETIDVNLTPLAESR